MNSFSILMLGLFLSLLIHYTFFYDHGKAYLSAMYHPGVPRTYRELIAKQLNRLVNWIINKLGKEVLDKLEKVGSGPREYVLFLLFVPLIFFVLGLLVGYLAHVFKQTPLILATVLALFGAFVGYVIVRAVLGILWRTYSANLKNGLPEWINNLRINIIAGDTMEQAFRESAEFVWGPVKKMVTVIIRWSDGEMSFSEALDRMIAETEDTDVLSVLQHIEAYHLSGIQDRNQVFGEMAEDMMRISADRQESTLESLEGQLTMLLIGGMMGDAVRIGAPVAALAFKNLLK